MEKPGDLITHIGNVCDRTKVSSFLRACSWISSTIINSELLGCCVNSNTLLKFSNFSNLPSIIKVLTFVNSQVPLDWFVIKCLEK